MSGFEDLVGLDMRNKRERLFSYCVGNGLLQSALVDNTKSSAPCNSAAGTASRQSKKGFMAEPSCQGLIDGKLVSPHSSPKARKPLADFDD
jgi:hypothetical protein